MAPSPLLDIRDLRTYFRTEEGLVRAVDGVSWSVGRKEILAIVGESGCGKSVSALSVMRLIPRPPGEVTGTITFQDDSMPQPCELLALPERRMRRLRGNRLAMIFQEPMTSLNPVFTIGDQIAEAVALHQGAGRKLAWDAAIEMLRKVGIAPAEKRVKDYPHQLSGGMRQRVMIAMALSCHPSLLIADEPTTALDVTVQAQILELLAELRESTGMSVILITHDLGVVAQIADQVCVMYAGRIVERADVYELFANPLHPYTQGLLRSIPRLAQPAGRLHVIPGAVPDPRHHPPGCRFHPRCDLTRERALRLQESSVALADGPDQTHVLARCVDDGGPKQTPPLREVRPGHFVACGEVEHVPG